VIVAEVLTADGAISSILGRLRLVGHHLYPLGEGRFGGDPSAGAASPTGLELDFQPEGIVVSWNARS
jgi:hypothetical protein